MKLPRIKPRIHGFCPIKGCGKPVSETSTTKVCREHMHTKPWCQCNQCQGGWYKNRIRTRDEMVKMGLLPR